MNTLADWQRALIQHGAVIAVGMPLSSTLCMVAQCGEILWSSVALDADGAQAIEYVSLTDAKHTASSVPRLPILDETGETIAWLILLQSTHQAENSTQNEQTVQRLTEHDADWLLHWFEHLQRVAKRRQRYSQRLTRWQQSQVAKQSMADIEQLFANYQQSGDPYPLEHLLKLGAKQFKASAFALHWRPQTQLLTSLPSTIDDPVCMKLRQHIRNSLWPAWVQQPIAQLQPTLQFFANSIEGVEQRLLVLPLIDPRQRLGGLVAMLVPANRNAQLDKETVYQGELFAQLVRRWLTSDLDEETGFLNHSAFSHQVSDWQSQHLPTAKRACLMSIELSAMDEVQQHCGALAAAACLRDLLALLETRLRARDILGRVGRTSLCVLLKQCDLTDAEAVVDALQDKLAGYRFTWGDRVFTAGVTIQVQPLDASTLPGRWHNNNNDTDRCTVKFLPSDAEELKPDNEGDVSSATKRSSGVEVHAADNVISIGGSSLAYVGCEVHSHSDDQDDKEIVSTLSMPRLQPIVDLGSAQEVAGYLLRSLGSSRADNGLPVSTTSKTSDIQSDTLAVDKFHLETVIKFVAAEKLHQADEALPVLVVDVGVELLSDAGMEWLLATCRHYRIQPDAICVSVNERIISTRLRATLPVLHRLSREGFHLMLDTCGDSPNAYMLFRRLPLSYIRPSAQLILAAAADRFQLAVLGAQIQVAHSVGAKVVCSGLDSESLLQRCRSLGADLGFGRYCGRSLSLEMLSSQRLKNI